MASHERLLREPPDAFRLAMGGLHQDMDIFCIKDGLTPGRYVAGFVHPKDHAALGEYLGALLTNERISNADIKGLINRHDTDFKFRKAGDAREFIIALRDALATNK
jgi:hypothetical protein